MNQQLIPIEDAAKDFINSKGGVVTVSSPNVGKLCCGHVNFAPEVKIGPPTDPENYYLGEFNGITVYQHKDIKPTSNLSIGLAKVLGIKYLVVNGWKLV
ncbi:hypothetical protein Desca_0966 [Desulfotomaculum nigrificans CO-1-SRB]|uniref:Uncharacterized protein n=1 Tax=Desulfotomaculum nigrificans (strain DSM 14880 / VKM B-2319 / CO-1-SRB) TaxID=868595 RepID=F6B2L3_DESCC|nr:CC/Se motif family (seleno)protein [Desulfotomaculum nigrificans]AEF93842.1 hypothetical protein Desca_0966 [Desulfotomaculum nigrificans CO-1-SRB]